MELNGDSLHIVVLIGRVWSKEMACSQNMAGEGWVVQGRGLFGFARKPPKNHILMAPKVFTLFLD